MSPLDTFSPRFSTPPQRYSQEDETQFRNEVVRALQTGVAELPPGTITGAKIKALDIEGKTITADTGTIGGWTLATGSLSSGNVTLSSALEALLLGSAVAPLTGVGVFLGKDGSDYEFRAGDPSGEYIHWDGTNLVMTGSIVSASALINNDVWLRWNDSGATPQNIMRLAADDDLEIQNPVGDILFGPWTVQADGDLQGDNNERIVLVSNADQNEMLRFSTDRPWVFEQENTGASTGLALRATTGGKRFRIWDPDRATGIFFLPDSTPVVHILQNANEILRMAHESATGSPYVSWYQSSTLRAFIQFLDGGGTFKFSNRQSGGRLQFFTAPAGSETLAVTIDSNLDLTCEGDVIANN